jgi:hypothetical protein
MSGSAFSYFAFSLGFGLGLLLLGTGTVVQAYASGDRPYSTAAAGSRLGGIGHRVGQLAFWAYGL